MTALKLVRSQLAAKLKAALSTDYVIFPDPNTLRDTITKPTLVLVRAAVRPSAQAPMSHFDNTFSLILVSADTGSEDALDDRLDEVLAALDTVPLVIFTEATRSTFSESNPSYEIALTSITSHS